MKKFTPVLELFTALFITNLQAFNILKNINL